MFKFLKRRKCKHLKEQLVAQWFEGNEIKHIRRNWKCADCGRSITR